MTARLPLAACAVLMTASIASSRECSEEAMHYIADQKQARVEQLQGFLREVNANLKQRGGRDVGLLAKKKATSKEIKGLRDGSAPFIPRLPALDRIAGQTGVVGVFNESENRFRVVRVLGADLIEAQQIIPTISLRAAGAELTQVQGADRLGPLVRLAGINTTGMEIGSTVRMTYLFEAVGTVPSGDGKCLEFAVVTIPAPAAQATKSASAKSGKKAKIKPMSIPSNQ